MHLHQRFFSLLAAFALLLSTTNLYAGTVAVQSNQRATPDSVERNNLEGNVHSGKRCTFSKKETIVVAVAWFFGGIPGAVLTPIACKRDLL